MERTNNMTFFISYFYQVRNFSSNMLPVSTAQYDPKWYHDSKGDNYCFLDKRQVINGVRNKWLAFPKEQWELMNPDDRCEKHCIHCHEGVNCEFMQRYYHWLSSLDFDALKDSIIATANLYAEHTHLPIDTIVLLVHEPPGCPCAERPVLQKWFREHGIELKEWTKPQ